LPIYQTARKDEHGMVVNTTASVLTLKEIIHIQKVMTIN
jgi:hypothetical protein